MLRLKIPETMQIDIPPKATSEQLEAIMKKAQTPKRFNAKKYAGKMKWGQDALAFQRELRGDS